MKNTSTAARGSQKNVSGVLNTRTLFNALGLLVTGFLLSQAVVFERLSPFALALVAAVSGIGAYAVAAGALAGFLLYSSATLFVKYTVALCLIGTAKWLFGFRKSAAKSVFFAPLITFFPCLAASFGLHALIGITVYDAMLSLAEAAMAAFFSFFFAQSIRAVEEKIAVSDLSVSQKGGFLLAFGLVLLPLSAIPIGYFSLGKTLAVLAVLILASIAGATVASVSGMVWGFLFVLADPSLLFLTVLLGFGGLLAGMFSDYGKAGPAIAMMGVTGLILLVTYNTESMPGVLFDACVACALFLVFPPKWLSRLSILPQAHSSDGFDDIKKAYMTRVSFLSEALQDVGIITGQVSDRLDKLRGNDASGLFEGVCRKVCSDCGLKNYCWVKVPNDTVKAFSDMLPILKKNGCITPEELPEQFKNRCCRSRDLASQTNVCYNEHIARDAARRRIGEVRHVIAGQFSAMAQVLDRLSGELADVRNVDPAATRKVRRALEELGLTLSFCYCLIGDVERMTVEFCVESFSRESVPDKLLTKAVCDATEREFEPPTVSQIHDRLRYTFNELANYCVQTAVYQIPHDKSRICGDTCAVFTDSRQFCNVILSDGMGKGRAAAVDSAMTVTLVTKLIKAGFDYADSVKMINSALLVKSDDESLSTVDAAQLDLYTGKLTLLKAGAPLTVVVKDRRPLLVEKSSVPIGIVDPVRPEQTEMYLSAGDLVIMMSDGICESGFDYLLEILKHDNALPVDELAKKICDTCVRENGIKDDLSVVAVRLCTNL